MIDLRENPCIGTHPDADPCPHCGTYLSDECPYENTLNRTNRTWTLTAEQRKRADEDAAKHPEGNIAQLLNPMYAWKIAISEEI